MTLDEYQIQATETAVYPQRRTDVGLAYTFLGLGGEVGELLQILKRVMRDRGGPATPEDYAKIRDELGDCLWYLALAADEIGLRLSDVAARNLDKLADRQARGVLHGEGGQR